MPDIDLTRQTSPIDAFQDAVRNSPPGTRIIYYRGEFLGGSRLARIALKSFELGHVELVQRRDVRGKKGLFEFIAVKKSGALSSLGSKLAK